MNGEIRIEERNPGYAISLVLDAKEYEMDKRTTLEDAKDFAFYLAETTQLPVIYQGDFQERKKEIVTFT